VHAGALDAQRDAEVNGGPAWFGAPAVAAISVARYLQELLPVAVENCS